MLGGGNGRRALAREGKRGGETAGARRCMEGCTKGGRGRARERGGASRREGETEKGVGDGEGAKGTEDGAGWREGDGRDREGRDGRVVRVHLGHDDCVYAQTFLSDITHPPRGKPRGGQPSRRCRLSSSRPRKSWRCHAAAPYQIFFRRVPLDVNVGRDFPQGEHARK